MGKIPFVKINAKNYSDFGFKFGSKLKKQIQFRLNKNKEIYKKYALDGKHFSIYVKKAKKFLPAIEKNFPDLLEEAKAMAEGAEVPFEELLVLMTDEEIITFKMFKLLHCTSLAIKTSDNNILLGHNEDWFAEYRKNGLALVNGKIKNTKFLSLGYIGSLIGSSSGLNNHGIAYADDSLSYTRFSYDVPRSFHLRALSEVKTPMEAKRVLDKHGSIVSSTLVVLSNKVITNVEELWNKDQFFKNNYWLVHTNHPLIKKDRNKYNTEKWSVRRCEKAKEIILKEKKLSLNTVKKVLKDHTTGICGHAKKHRYDDSVTIASVIMNPKDKWLLLCNTNPCKGIYKKYHL